MTTEENKRMLALSYIVADLKAENIEMTQRASAHGRLQRCRAPTARTGEAQG